MEHRSLPERTVLLVTGAILVVLMVVGSIWDYSISRMLYSPGNSLGKFLAAFGEYPMGLALAAAGAMFLSARNPGRKAISVLQIILGVFLILSSFSMLVQIPVRQSSLPIPISAGICLVFVSSTVWGVLSLCRGASRRTVIRTAIVFMLVAFLEMILVNIIKIPWGRPRMRLVATDSRACFLPWWQPGRGLRDALVAEGVKSEEFKSFPSSHAANASCLMLMCLLSNISPKLEKKRTMLFLIGFGWACLVAFSRIIMGAHYLTDTVVGISIEYVVFIAVTSLLMKDGNRQFKTDGEKIPDGDMREADHYDRRKQKLSKKAKMILIVIVVLLLAASIAPAVVFMRQALCKGNQEQYSVASTPALESSPLSGKKIIFLGSSVTYGSAAKGESFVDYMVKRDGIIATKEAVSGTLLVDQAVYGKKSYITRMKTIPTDIQADAFVCQLSTNDATMKKKLGTVSDSFAIEDFDTQTVAGAIEYVIAYAKQTWNCPVIFYTGTRYDSTQYQQMVDTLLKIQKKWDIGVIDLWNDPEMNAVSQEDYKIYMVNGIHPSRAGYRDWWTPKFEAYLSNYLAQ